MEFAAIQRSDAPQLGFWPCASVTVREYAQRFSGAVLLSLAFHAVAIRALTGEHMPLSPPKSDAVNVEILRIVSSTPRELAKPAPRKTTPLRRRHALAENTPTLAQEAPSPETVVGMTKASIAPAGVFAVAVGSTLLGAAPLVAPGTRGESAEPPGEGFDEPPAIQSRFAIPYPPAAERAGIAGTVVMRVGIDSAGRVTTVNLIQGAGFGLDQAAMEALRHFRFTPARRHGEPVASEITYRYRFELR
jgi:periplasmic protein TonB